MNNDNAPHEAVAGIDCEPPTIEQLLDAMTGVGLTGGTDFSKRDIDHLLTGPFVAVHFAVGDDEQATRFAHLMQALWAAAPPGPDSGVVIGVRDER